MEDYSLDFNEIQVSPIDDHQTYGCHQSSHSSSDKGGTSVEALRLLLSLIH